MPPVARWPARGAKTFGLVSFGIVALILGSFLVFSSRSANDVLPAMARSAADIVRPRRRTLWSGAGRRSSTRSSLVRALERAAKRRNGF